MKLSHHTWREHAETASPGRGDGVRKQSAITNAAALPTANQSPCELKHQLELERQGRPFVVFRNGEGKLVVVPLPGGREITIGRRADSKISLAWDQAVSRLHAELECVGDEWLLVDDGLSRNGTFVNDECVAGRRRLIDGDLDRDDVGVFDAGGAEGLAPEALAGPGIGRLFARQDLQRARLFKRPVARTVEDRGCASSYLRLDLEAAEDRSRRETRHGAAPGRRLGLIGRHLIRRRSPCMLSGCLKGVPHAHVPCRREVQRHATVDGRHEAGLGSSDGQGGIP